MHKKNGSAIKNPLSTRHLKCHHLNPVFRILFLHHQIQMFIAYQKTSFISVLKNFSTENNIRIKFEEANSLYIVKFIM